jgi:hypothetical protein
MKTEVACMVLIFGAGRQGALSISCYSLKALRSGSSGKFRCNDTGQRRQRCTLFISMPIVYFLENSTKGASGVRA